MEIIYMKTSIVKLSVNETLCINGGVGSESSVNHIDILSASKALISSHSKQIGAVSAGGAILTVISVVAKFAFNLSKENAALNILRKTINLAS